MKKNCFLLITGIMLFTLAFQLTPVMGENLWTYDSPLVGLYSKQYEAEPIVILSIAQRMNYPDDVSVALYIAKITGTDPVEILNTRLTGKKWQEIIDEKGIKPEDIFIKLDKKRTAWIVINEKTVENMKVFITKEKLEYLQTCMEKEISEEELIENLKGEGFENEEIERVIFYSHLNTIPSTFRRAFKEYTKYTEDNSYDLNLYDGEIRNLIQLKFCTDFLGMDPWYVIETVDEGYTFTDLIMVQIDPAYILKNL